MIYKGMICQWCGATFTAQKSNTKYCSKRCADQANKDRIRNMAKTLVDSQNEIQMKALDKCAKENVEILSPILLGLYLGVSRTTSYDYISRGIIPALKIRGKTFVRRSDVDKLFDSAPPYRNRNHDGKRKEEAAPQELMAPDDGSIKGGSELKGGKNVNGERYTTVKDVAERYGLSLSGTDKILKESGLTIIRHKGKNYYYLNEVESLFRKRQAESHPEISEWYTCAEIQEKYQLKPASIYDIASTFRIPTKKVHNVTYYSKVHFDMSRGIKPADSEMWYTVQEAMEKYGQTRDQVYNVLRYNNIQRVQVGRNVKFRRCDYDEAMKFSVISNK